MGPKSPGGPGGPTSPRGLVSVVCVGTITFADCCSRNADFSIADCSAPIIDYCYIKYN